MQIQPYLFLGGRCEEAIGFYSKSLGAKVEMMLRYKDSPEPPPPGMVPPGYENKIMHGAFQVGGSMVLVSDGCGETTLSGFSLSLTVADEAEADRAYNALADGGNVQMPLGKTFFSPRFGMVTDRFGVSWMVYVTPPKP